MADGHRTVERHHGRRLLQQQGVVVFADAQPVGLSGLQSARMASGNARLQRVRPQRLRSGVTQRLRLRQGGQTAPDQQAVPAPAVLVQQQHRAALRVNPRGCQPQRVGVVEHLLVSHLAAFQAPLFALAKGFNDERHVGHDGLKT